MNKALSKEIYTFTDLYLNAAGEAIEYTIEEEAVTGYTPAYAVTANGFTVTNTHEADIYENVTIVKAWEDNDNQDGVRPQSITVKLLANSKELATKELTAADNWTWTIDKLYVNEDGEAIVYAVEEVEIEGYATEITGNAADGFIITNTRAPEKID